MNHPMVFIVGLFGLTVLGKSAVDVLFGADSYAWPSLCGNYPLKLSNRGNVELFS